MAILNYKVVDQKKQTEEEALNQLAKQKDRNLKASKQATVNGAMLERIPSQIPPNTGKPQPNQSDKGWSGVKR